MTDLTLALGIVVEPVPVRFGYVKVMVDLRFAVVVVGKELVWFERVNAREIVELVWFVWFVCENLMVKMF